MNTVLHDFTGSFCIAAMSMFSPAYALTNIELADNSKNSILLENDFDSPLYRYIMVRDFRNRYFLKGTDFRKF